MVYDGSDVSRARAEMREIPICIGGKMRIDPEYHFRPGTHSIGVLEMRARRAPPDNRIGVTHTTIRVPRSLDVAYDRYRQDPLFHEVIKHKAHEGFSTPKQVMKKHAGKELHIPNVRLGVEQRAPYPSHNTPTERRTQDAEEDEEESDPSTLHKIIRALKPY